MTRGTARLRRAENPARPSSAPGRRCRPACVVRRASDLKIYARLRVRRRSPDVTTPRARGRFRRRSRARPPNWEKIRACSKQRPRSSVAARRRGSAGGTRVVSSLAACPSSTDRWPRYNLSSPKSSSSRHSRTDLRILRGGCA